MTAITVDTQRRVGLHPARKIGLPVAAGENIPAGSLAVTNATGFAENGTNAALKIFQGVVTRGYDNTNGPDGAMSDLSSERIIEADRAGQWEIAVSGGTPLPGMDAYLVDNNTVSVAATSENILVGTFAQPGRPGSWYVDLEGRSTLGEML